MKTFNRKVCPELQSLPTEEINGKRYYVTPTGNRLPSVTTVLGHFKKASLAAWRARVGHEEANAISNRAATRGTKLHNMLEKFLENTPTSEILVESVMPDLRQAFNDMTSILVERLDNIHYIESQLYSETLRLAGRTDVIAEFDGVPAIIDFKTSARTKRESEIQDYFLQGTAYALMYEERVGTPIDRIVILISPNDGNEIQVFVKDKTPYIQPLMEKILQYHKEMAL